MAENSKIEWTESTWNPWHGCIKVSPGCKFCYMYTEKKFYGQNPALVVRSKTKFNDPLKWVRSGKAPKFCFTCSWSDFFIDTADQWRPEAWEIIRKTPQITYQILTKRPERIAEHLPADWGAGYPNVWLGVSVETPEYLPRFDELLKIPAVIHWGSLEPLLADLGRIMKYLNGDPVFHFGDAVNAVEAKTIAILQKVARGAYLKAGGRLLDWLVVGGESGPKARPMHPDWARSLRDQCLAAGVAFFFKQWGEWAPGENGNEPPKKSEQTATRFANKWDFGRLTPRQSEEINRDDEPDVYRLGKKNAGRLLDGKEHSEYPEVRQ